MNRIERAAMVDIHKIWRTYNQASGRRAPSIHCAKCGQYKVHHGKGLCSSCYVQRSRTDTRK